MEATKIDDVIVTAINKAARYPSILKMGVFGSYARGEQNVASDVDIIYDYDDTMVSDMLNCLHDIENHVNKKIDFIAYYLLFDEDIDEYDVSFRENVLKEVVWIYKKQ